jgi:tetratricopeptide (TPR) repeat protein
VPDDATGVTLPDLRALTINDGRLCGHAADRDAVVAALAAGERALATARGWGDRREEARMLGYCAEAKRLLGKEADAIPRVEAALAIARDLGDEQLLRANTIRLGELARSAGDVDTAIRVLREALAAAREDRYLLDFALQHLGKALWNAGRASEAVPLLEEALAIRRASGSAGLVASTEEALAAARGSV